MSQARQWLRDELADDREAIAAKSATDWLVTLVDILLAPLLAWRACIASWVWLVHHGHSADVGTSISDSAMIADAWTAGDAREVVLVAAVLPVFFVSTELCCRPLPAVASIYLWVQAGGLAVEGGLVLSRVRA
jgi:hypothetical protein